MSLSSSSNPHRPISKARRRWRRFALGGYRLGLIAAAFAAVFIGRPEKTDVDPRRLLAGARQVIPETVSLDDPTDGFSPMLDGDDEIVGWVTSSFPQAAPIQGYSGPSELLIVLDAQRKVRAVELLQSADTSGHVGKIEKTPEFWEQWTGQPESRLGALESPVLVSGATLTSEAMTRGVAARFGATGLDQYFSKTVEPKTVAGWFPEADQVEITSKAGVSRIFAGDRELGTVLRSSQMGVSARGFNGTSDVLIGLSLDGTQVLGVTLLESRDNEPYVSDVQEELTYADGFAGQKVATVLEAEFSDGLIVSGASVTTYAVITSVREMLRRHQVEESKSRIPWAGLATLGWIVVGLVSGLTKRGSKRNARILVACASVAAGLTLGWMVGQDQLIGWARHGVDTSTSLTLIVLTAVALLVPVLTGKNVYCSRICPHGAAQTLAGQVTKKRWIVPAKWRSTLQRLPWLTLLVIWALALLGSGLPFANAEPFEIWSIGFHAFLPAAIFTVGLVAAFFMPQAYCHYGCPTGALLKFLTHSPSRFTRRDTIAGLLVAVAWAYVLIQ